MTISAQAVEDASHFASSAANPNSELANPNSSELIPINVQTGKINRQVKPALVGSHMSDPHWYKFCDEIDGSIQPYTRHVRIARSSFTTASLTMFIAIMMFGPLNFNIIVIIAAAVIFAIMCVMAIFSSCKTKTLFPAAEAEMRRICEQYSNEIPSVQFQYYRDRQIQKDMKLYVRVNGDAPSATLPDFTSVPASTAIPVTTGIPVDGIPPLEAAPTMVTATPIADATPAEAAPVGGFERLSQLENMKSHLTEEEYQQKRNDILDSLYK